MKKIPSGLRRRRFAWRKEPTPWCRATRRLRDDGQYLRTAVQFTFLGLCGWIGVEFWLFMQWGRSAGATAFVERPPGVEGFLPISALISLVHWIRTGVINQIHPSGLFIFLAVVGLSFAVRKGFCSWLCPVGTISESLWKLGRKLFGRNLAVARWLDYPLRSLKYLLLAFFLQAILPMSATELEGFIESPYNRMADVKMYLFFADISSFALWTIVILIVLSVFVRNFWCRYLCPYGALLAIPGWLSPAKITRNPVSCIDCNLCTAACPSSIRVHAAGRVWSDECTACLECVDVCPVKDTLGLRAKASRRFLPGWAAGTIIAAVFVGVTGYAMLAGNWRNGISHAEYMSRFRELTSAIYAHPR